MDVSIRALTVCQPHAHFIVARPEELAKLTARNPIPPKRIENRTWPTNYRGQLLIHAGKNLQWLEDWEGIGLPELPFGAFVGICELADCLTWGEGPYPPWIVDHFHRSLEDTKHWWILDKVRRFRKPVPWMGKQGLWKPFTHGRTLHNCPEGRLLRQAISTAEAIEWSPEAIAQ